MLALLMTLTMFAAEPPDAIFHNGVIDTGDAAVPTVQALAVKAGIIVQTGTNDDVKKTAGPTTKLIDLQGRTVVPGIYDSHVHWLGGGLQLSRVELKDAANEAEFGKRLKAFDDVLPRDRWILGGNWDHDRTFAGKLPTAALLDRYVPTRPAYIARYDAHMALANTSALKLAGITAETKDPPGGVIERAADGKTPTGVLKDNAMDLLEKLIPDPSDEEIAEAVRAAMKAAAAVGVTSVQDMEGSTPRVRAKLLRVLKALEARNELTCRVSVRFPIAVQGDIAVAEFTPGAFVEIAGVKGYMDGSLGSSTARMFEPYLLDKTTRGVFVTQPDAMQTLVLRADKAGLSCAIHAIGDEANASLLDAFAEVAKLNGPRDRRFRIEHAQHLRAQDYPRFRLNGVVASMQPFHVVDDARWAEGRIGGKRCESSYAFRSLTDAGAVLAFGSDWPVAPLNPWLGIDAAVNRRPLDSKETAGWYPEQCITVREALKAYNAGSAFAGRHDATRGTLTVGRVADFAVLDRDLFDAKLKNELGKIEVMLTVSAGRVVHRR